MFVVNILTVRRWSDDEKQAVQRRLGHLLQVRRPPRKHECDLAIQQEPALCQRDWRAVKNHMASLIRYARMRDRSN